MPFFTALAGRNPVLVVHTLLEGPDAAKIRHFT